MMNNDSCFNDKSEVEQDPTILKVLFDWLNKEINLTAMPNSISVGGHEESQAE